MTTEEQIKKTSWSSDADIYDNTQKEVIVVHPHTLDNKLRDFELGLGSKKELRHSVELILALLGILLTANFKDFLGVPSQYWFGTFFFALLWALYRLCIDLVPFKKFKKPTRQDILNELMNESRKIKG